MYKVQGFNRFKGYPIVQLDTKSPLAALKEYCKQNNISYTDITKVTNKLIGAMMLQGREIQNEVDFVVDKVDDYLPTAGGMYILHQ